MGAVKDRVEEGTLNAAARKKLSKSEFAIPETKSYPIHDLAHARNALARVAQHGTPEEKARVRAAVKRRYPNIVQEGVYDEAKHPRGRGGKWVRLIGGLNNATGNHLKVGHVTVTREGDTYHVHGHGAPAHHVKSADEAARIAASEEARIKAGPKPLTGKQITAQLGAEMIVVNGVRDSRLRHAARLKASGADAKTIDRVAFGTRAEKPERKKQKSAITLAVEQGKTARTPEKEVQAAYNRAAAELRQAESDGDEERIAAAKLKMKELEPAVRKAVGASPELPHVRLTKAEEQRPEKYLDDLRRSIQSMEHDLEIVSKEGSGDAAVFRHKLNNLRAKEKALLAAQRKKGDGGATADAELPGVRGNLPNYGGMRDDDDFWLHGAFEKYAAGDLKWDAEKREWVAKAMAGRTQILAAVRKHYPDGSSRLQRAARYLKSKEGKSGGGDDTDPRTPAGEEKGLDFFKTLSLKELRRRQDLATQQIKLAHDQKNTEALERLQKTHDLLSAAVHYITFEKKKKNRKKVREGANLVEARPGRSPKPPPPPTCPPGKEPHWYPNTEGGGTWRCEAGPKKSGLREDLEEVESKVYPGLDRSSKKNWVDQVGGLPSYIERVAKHLHYEKGRPIGTAIATAINHAKKMCASGTAFGGKVQVSAKARAVACKAVAEWEAKKARSKGKSLKESDAVLAEGLLIPLALVRAVEPLERTTEIDSVSAHDIGAAAEHRRRMIVGLLETLRDHDRHIRHQAMQTAYALLHDVKPTDARKLTEADYGEVAAMRATLHEEAQEAKALREGMGYQSYPMKGEKGRFHGMHGVERASKKGGRMLKGEGAAKCASCKSIKPSADAACPKCGSKRTLKEAVATEKGGGTATAAATKEAKKPGTKAAARPKQKGRGGKPVQDKSFEKQHPRQAKGRVGGGEWVQKGEGKDAPSERVKYLQVRLTELGFTLAPDGNFGPNTESAVKSFQKAYGLKETGKVDAATTETLRNPPPQTISDLRAEDAAAAAGKGKGGSKKPSTPTTSSRSGAGPAGPGGSGAGTDRPDRPTTMSHSGASMIRRGDGMRGQPDSKVEKVQQQLDDLGFDLGSGGVDGRFGEETESAVRAFQKKYGLRVDGVVSEDTLRKLKQIINKRKKEQGEREMTGEDVAPAKKMREGDFTDLLCDLVETIEERQAAAKEGRGTEFHRALAREQIERARLEEAADADPEYEKLLKKFKANGMPHAAASKAARKVCASKKVQETLDEAVAHSIGLHFDPALHPRNRLGEFRDLLGRLGKGNKIGSVHLGDVTVSKRAGRFRVNQRGRRLGSFRSPEDAARTALRAQGGGVGVLAMRNEGPSAADRLDAMRVHRATMVPGSPEHVAITSQIAALARKDAKLPSITQRRENEAVAREKLRSSSLLWDAVLGGRTPQYPPHPDGLRGIHQMQFEHELQPGDKVVATWTNSNNNYGSPATVHQVNKASVSVTLDEPIHDVKYDRESKSFSQGDVIYPAGRKINVPRITGTGHSQNNGVFPRDAVARSEGPGARTDGFAPPGVGDRVRIHAADHPHIGRSGVMTRRIGADALVHLDGGKSIRIPNAAANLRALDSPARSEGPGDILDSIGPGDRVTIRTPHGSERTGRAVMRGPAGWVLNLGGAHGTPGIADERNIVKIKKARTPGPTIPGGPRSEGPSDRVMGSDAAVAVGRFQEGGPDGYKAATWPGAKVRKRRETAVEDERKWLEIRHRDFSTGDLPPVADLKYLTDDQVAQLVERIIPQRRPGEGEAFPDTPAFKDYPRRIAEQANRRATRRYQEGPPDSARSEGPGKRELDVFEKRQLRIARDTLKMNPAISGVMGGPSREEAIDIIERLTGERPTDPFAVARSEGVGAPGVGDRVMIEPEHPEVPGATRLRGIVRGVSDGQVEVEVVGSNRRVTVPASRVVRPVRSEGPGDGEATSKGHVAFIGKHEFFYGPDGDLYRGQRDATLDLNTGYRVGARFEAAAHNANYFLKQARDREAARSEGPGPPPGRSLSVPERHQLRVARDTLKMNPAMSGVMGGPSRAEAIDIIERLTGKRPVDPHASARSEGPTRSLAGPALSDKVGWANSARQSASQARIRASELRALGNEEHARDYDEIARNMERRADRLDSEASLVRTGARSEGPGGVAVADFVVPDADLEPIQGQMSVTIRERPEEFMPGDLVVLADGRVGHISSKSFGGKNAWSKPSDETRPPQYSVAVGGPTSTGYTMEYGVKHSDLSFQAEEIERRRAEIDALIAKGQKKPTKRAQRPFASGATLSPTQITGSIPDQWLVDQGYAEWQNPSYTNPQEGDRVTVMPSSTGFDRYRGKKGVVVRKAYTSGTGRSTMLDVKFDDGETGQVPNTILMGEAERAWARIKPGQDAEAILYHYLVGKKLKPSSFPKGSRAAAQWDYKRKGKRADQDALVRKLTAAYHAREEGDAGRYLLGLREAVQLRVGIDRREAALALATVRRVTRLIPEHKLSEANQKALREAEERVQSLESVESVR